MAAAPAVVGFVGAGTLDDAIGYTKRMAEITVGPNPEWTLPTLTMPGVPTGIDIRKVVIVRPAAGHQHRRSRIDYRAVGRSAPAW